jgi:hypothetical protein
VRNETQTHNAGPGHSVEVPGVLRRAADRGANVPHDRLLIAPVQDAAKSELQTGEGIRRPTRPRTTEKRELAMGFLRQDRNQTPDVRPRRPVFGEANAVGPTIPRATGPDSGQRWRTSAGKAERCGQGEIDTRRRNLNLRFLHRRHETWPTFARVGRLVVDGPAMPQPAWPQHGATWANVAKGILSNPHSGGRYLANSGSPAWPAGTGTVVRTVYL